MCMYVVGNEMKWSIFYAPPCICNIHDPAADRSYILLTLTTKNRTAI